MIDVCSSGSVAMTKCRLVDYRKNIPQERECNSHITETFSLFTFLVRYSPANLLFHCSLEDNYVLHLCNLAYALFFFFNNDVKKSLDWRCSLSHVRYQHTVVIRLNHGTDTKDMRLLNYYLHQNRFP